MKLPTTMWYRAGCPDGVAVLDTRGGAGVHSVAVVAENVDAETAKSVEAQARSHLTKAVKGSKKTAGDGWFRTGCINKAETGAETGADDGESKPKKKKLKVDADTSPAVAVAEPLLDDITKAEAAPDADKAEQGGRFVNL